MINISDISKSNELELTVELKALFDKLMSDESSELNKISNNLEESFNNIHKLIDEYIDNNDMPGTAMALTLVNTYAVQLLAMVLVYGFDNVESDLFKANINEIDRLTKKWTKTKVENHND